LSAELPLAVAPQAALLLALLDRARVAPAASETLGERERGQRPPALGLPEAERALVEPGTLTRGGGLQVHTAPIGVERRPDRYLLGVPEAEELVAAGELDEHGAARQVDVARLAGHRRRELDLGRRAAELERADVAGIDVRRVALIGA